MCPNLNQKLIEFFKKESDIIAIGKPIRFYTIDNAYSGYRMVEFEIDSLIKGEKGVECIIIDQNSMGNCGVYFELCEEYIITGEKITSPIQTYSMTQENHSKELETILNENYTITTSQCRSFRLDTKLADKFLKTKINNK